MGMKGRKRRARERRDFRKPVGRNGLFTRAFG
jgi:hypothetical protein